MAGKGRELNEILFILWTTVVLAGVLAAWRFGGKAGVWGAIGLCIVLANLFVTKQITLFGLAATGGNSLYGAIFLATDVLNEHMGKREARRAVWFGWVCALAFLVATQVFLLFAPSSFDFVHDAMRTLFSLSPRIVAASLVAYLVSQTHDVVAYHAWRVRTGGRKLWVRNLASTSVSQLIDSVIFTSIAFLGVFPLMVVVQVAISTYLLKLLVALLDTPFIYLSARWMPKDRESMKEE